MLFFFCPQVVHAEMTQYEERLTQLSESLEDAIQSKQDLEDKYQKYVKKTFSK